MAFKVVNKYQKQILTERYTKATISADQFETAIFKTTSEKLF